MTVPVRYTSIMQAAAQHSRSRSLSVRSADGPIQAPSTGPSPVGLSEPSRSSSWPKATPMPGPAAKALTDAKLSVGRGHACNSTHTPKAVPRMPGLAGPRGTRIGPTDSR